MIILIHQTKPGTSQSANGRYKVEDIEGRHYFLEYSEVTRYLRNFLDEHRDELVGIPQPIDLSMSREERNGINVIVYAHNLTADAPLLVTPLEGFPGASMICVKGDIHGGMPVKDELIPLFEGRSNKTMPERLEEVVRQGKVDVDPWGRIHPKGSYSLS